MLVPSMKPKECTLDGSHLNLVLFWIVLIQNVDVGLRAIF
jgi:hypothetical protein